MRRMFSEKQIEKISSEVAEEKIQELKNPKYVLQVNLGFIHLTQTYNVSFTTEINQSEFSFNEDDSANVNIEKQLSILYNSINGDSVIEESAFHWCKVIIEVEEGSMTSLSIESFTETMIDYGEILLYIEGEEEEPRPVFSA